MKPYLKQPWHASWGIVFVGPLVLEGVLRYHRFIKTTIWREIVGMQTGMGEKAQYVEWDDMTTSCDSVQ